MVVEGRGVQPAVGVGLVQPGVGVGLAGAMASGPWLCGGRVARFDPGLPVIRPLRGRPLERMRNPYRIP